MHWPEKLLLAHIIPTCLLIGIGLHELYINPNDKNASAAGAIVFFCLSFTLIFGLLNVGFNYITKKNKNDIQSKVAQRITGFLFITLIGISIRIWVYFVKEDDIQLDYMCITTFLITAQIAHYFFISGSHKYCTWDKTLSRKISRWNVPVQVIILFVSFYLAKEYCRELKKDITCLYHIGLFGLCLAGVQEILEFQFGALKLKEKYVNGGVELKTVKVEKVKKEKKSFTLECKISMVQYSEPAKTARILKERGHAVCETCAQQLLRAHNGNHISCPHCQAVTLVHGWWKLEK